MPSEETYSKVMGGPWHHPRIGGDESGKAIFLPNMEYARLLRDRNFKLWYDHFIKEGVVKT